MADTDDAIRFKAVNHITYNVTDLNRALRFWVDVLGVKQIPKQVDSDRLLWLQVPSGTMVHIILNDDAPSAPSHHSAFEVDDIEAAERAMKAKGLETTAISTRNDGQRAFNINDPDGNRIEICTVSGFAAVT
jgi:catechol 2,3-dioxygenase-like lactoylglutathione lyase family enzyme